MKKQLNLAILTFLFCSCSYAQDMGFRTTDIGAEYQWYPRGTIYNLHVAFNAKLNHSIQLRLGYNHVPVFNAGSHKEFGKGWGGGLGYRYYFKPFPYKFFIGARADIWLMDIEEDYSPTDFGSEPDNYLVLQPALEAGYTFVINDVLYITPYAAAGFQTQFEGGAKYGNGFVPTAGISAGFRF
ncbi:MAG TPA: hypothetical protein VK483_13970 [Chitinophagaceae bacterium]|nr:hypothetical protein [Chitinophagaceae bacterium]